MPVPSLLNVHRHDYWSRTLITVAGDIDLDSVPLLRAALEQCLLDGIRTIEVDLSAVTFCDCTGLNVFLTALQCTAAAGGTLRLHHPSAPVARLLALTGSAAPLVAPAAPLSPWRPVVLYRVTRQSADAVHAALHGAA
ncbi:STAS domain-containing protein [Streptomyces sp. SID13588]|uniref:STAS domain-containing protein n=1 Tax=Streptomyces sp. SID13588 TaxID=2706051 RepID=UPI0013C56344|nr:STAS domain-containing protein [Streptomyces sp. SID13588]NEA72728.1 STAS domain-containing protein [Streptomyces sp. SID13588]